MQESEYWGQMPVIDVQWTRLVQIPALGLLVVLQVWVSVSSLRTPVTVYSLFLQGLSPQAVSFSRAGLCVSSTAFFSHGSLVYC